MDIKRDNRLERTRPRLDICRFQAESIPKRYELVYRLINDANCENCTNLAINLFRLLWLNPNHSHGSGATQRFTVQPGKCLETCDQALLA